MDVEKHNMEISEKYMKYINPGLMRLVAFMGFDTVEISSQGSIIRDNTGREFIDCLGGFGIYSVGHRHPRIMNALKDQLERIPFPSKVLLNEPMANLAQKLAEITPGKLQYTFMCNSGTEATEGALKIARLANWGYFQFFFIEKNLSCIRFYNATYNFYNCAFTRSIFPK